MRMRARDWMGAVVSVVVGVLVAEHSQDHPGVDHPVERLEIGDMTRCQIS